MTISLVAADYSRPIQPIFAGETRVGNIHSVFHKAVNIALDDTMLALLSLDVPRMPNSVRLPPVMAEKLLPQLRPGMEAWIGNEKLLIPACNFSLHLPKTSPWEPRPCLAANLWHRETLAQHIRLLALHLADQPRQ